jgi:MFS family permease
MAWHAVAWVTLLNAVEDGEVGRSTGIVQFGNSAGVAAGPPIVGFIVDSTGSYAWGWASIVGLLAVLLALTVAWRLSVR